jgi:lysophospholipase L1-like esterase
MSQQTPSRRVARRDFITSSSTVLGAAGLFGWSSTVTGQAAESSSRKHGGMIESNDVVLFQGDSITDAGRNRKAGTEPNNQAGLGSGYAWLAAAQLLTGRPKDGLKVFNRGISGHKVFQLAERWQRDCLDLKPNVLSILIGVNDIWHSLNGGYQGTVEIYERDYRALLERTQKALPQVGLVICEPFVLRCGAVNDKWFPEFQTMFDTAIQYAPPEHWAKDGVHPSPAGASLMAHTWLKTVSNAE